MREYVGRAGFRLEFACQPSLYDRFSATRMRNLAFQPDTAAWVLLNATREIQEWFVSSGLPCVVTGSCHEGVDLPNVEFDYAACCFHAVHLLASQGHGHVVYVTQALLNASEQSAVRGFLEAANRFPRLKATVTRHDATREGICQALRSLLTGSPKPTGYLVSSPEPTLTTLGFLSSQGVRVPADASVICCIDSPFLNYHLPSVAQYRTDCVKSGHVAGALAVDVIRHGAGRSRHVKIVPVFVPGQTLASGSPWTPAKTGGNACTDPDALHGCPTHPPPPRSHLEPAGAAPTPEAHPAEARPVRLAAESRAHTARCGLPRRASNRLALGADSCE